MINLTKNLYIINKKMKENEKELVDLDEEGKIRIIMIMKI